MRNFFSKWWPFGKSDQDLGYLPTQICMSCFSIFNSEIYQPLCDNCMNEAMQNRPTLYAEIALVGGGTFVQELDQVGVALDGEFDGAEAGQTWTVTLVQMTPAEYELLPDFDGH